MLPLSFKALFLPRSFSRFAVVGVINTGMGIGLYPVMNWLTQSTIDHNVLLVISYVICTISAFMLHRFFTFKSSGAYHKEAVKYIILSLVTFAVNYVVLNVALHYFNVSVNLVQIIISTVLSAALMLANYFGLTYLVFKKVQDLE
ncbi:MAG: GtrA family protein [Alphaproteobacteria bacterium]|nr:GtrA family protein [Alphaproteobacteria bacterium]